MDHIPDGTQFHDEYVHVYLNALSGRGFSSFLVVTAVSVLSEKYPSTVISHANSNLSYPPLVCQTIRPVTGAPLLYG
jgi:hypothetical protein